MSIALQFIWKFRTALISLVAVALIFSWRWDHNRLADANADLTYKLSIATDTANSYSKVNTGLINRVSDQNKQIEKLIADGESLRVELSKKFEQFEAEKRDLLKQIAALPPLPADCEGAVRETARSLKAMTGGE